MKGKILKVIEDIKNGRPVIIIDDYYREDEGDFMLAGELANIENMAFIKREAGGLMCIPAEGSILDRLGIEMMVENPTDKLGTPFTVSVDSKENASTGMSISDRLKLVQLFINDDTKPDAFAKPGHMFPLRPKQNLLADRRGHTEASIELCKLAGLKQVALIIEIMNPDGTMSRLGDLEKISEKFELNLISVEEIYEAVYNEGL